MLYSVNKYQQLSHQFINTYISDYEIYSYYLGESFKVGQIFNSPFHEDNHPSFGIFEVGSGKLLYKDHSLGLSGNAIHFVQKFNSLPTYKSALNKIYVDLILNKEKKQPKDKIKMTKYRVHEKQPVSIGIKTKSITNADSAFWLAFNISRAILNFFEVKPIQYMFIGPFVKHEYANKNPMYAYKVYDKFKIYRPLADKASKWYGNLTKNYIHGYKQLPEKGKLLIITKSLKDTMCLYSLGYTAISPPSEGTLIPDFIISKLKKRFTNVVVLYDNDEPGEVYAERISKRYNLPTRIIPKDSGEKDTSDFFKKYKKQKTIKMLQNLFKDFEVSQPIIHEKEDN